MADYVTCEACRARAAGFLVPSKQAKECLRRDDTGDILARETTALVQREWRQEVPRYGKETRQAIWRRKHVLDVASASFGEDPVHLWVSNPDNSRAHSLLLCKAPEQLVLAGPGAKAHIEADANEIARYAAEQDEKARDKALKDAMQAERGAYGRQLKTALESLGFDVSYASGRDPLLGRAGITFGLDGAARVVEALGGMVARPDDAPMPLWQVSYDGEDFAYVAGRTEAAVRAYVLDKYRSSDERDGRLDSRKLAVRPAPEPLPYPPEPAEEDAA
jgi:hypothetical protein